jgi:hypothetical protein
LVGNAPNNSVRIGLIRGLCLIRAGLSAFSSELFFNFELSYFRISTARGKWATYYCLRALAYSGYWPPKLQDF